MFGQKDGGTVSFIFLLFTTRKCSQYFGILLKNRDNSTSSVNANSYSLFCTDLGKMEDGIFKKRRERELHFRAMDKRKKMRVSIYDRLGEPCCESRTM